MSKKPKEEKADHSKEIEEWKNKYLRALADYQNLEKRQVEEATRIRKQSTKNLFLKFLEVLDDVESAETFVKDPGLKHVKDKFIKILQSEAVEELPLLGKSYDPHLAECIEVIPGQKDNIIVDIVRKGYKLGDEILRVARVKVEKKL